jgi:hypothetical protein
MATLHSFAVTGPTSTSSCSAFNRRRTRHAAFRSLLGIAAGHAPLTYNMLISPEA